MKTAILRTVAGMALFVAAAEPAVGQAGVLPRPKGKTANPELVLAASTVASGARRELTLRRDGRLELIDHAGPFRRTAVVWLDAGAVGDLEETLAALLLVPPIRARPVGRGAGGSAVTLAIAGRPVRRALADPAWRDLTTLLDDLAALAELADEAAAAAVAAPIVVPVIPRRRVASF